MSDEANVGSAELCSTEVQGRDAEDSNKGSQSGIIKLDAIRRIIDKVNASVIPLMQRSVCYLYYVCICLCLPEETLRAGRDA